MAIFNYQQANVGNPATRDAFAALVAEVQKLRNGLVQKTVTLSPAQVAANTTAEQIFAVTGATVGSGVVVNKPTAQAGLGIVGARVSTAGNVGITFSNNTAGAITPTASEAYVITLLPALVANEFVA